MIIKLFDRRWCLVSAAAFLLTMFCSCRSQRGFVDTTPLVDPEFPPVQTFEKGAGVPLDRHEWR